MSGLSCQLSEGATLYLGKLAGRMGPRRKLVPGWGSRTSEPELALQDSLSPPLVLRILPTPLQALTLSSFAWLQCALEV